MPFGSPRLAAAEVKQGMRDPGRCRGPMELCSHRLPRRTEFAALLRFGGLEEVEEAIPHRSRR